MQPKDHMSIAVVYLLSVKVHESHLKMNLSTRLKGRSKSVEKYIVINKTIKKKLIGNQMKQFPVAI